MRGAIFDDGANLVSFLDRRQDLARKQHIANGVIAAFSGKDEEDRGQHCVVVEHGRDVDRSRATFAGIARPSTISRERSTTATTRLGSAESLLSATECLYVAMNSWWVLELATRFEQFVEFPAGVHVLKQWHGSVLRDDDVGVPANRSEPLAEFLGVGHGRRERHDRHVLGQVKNDFFPDRSAELVGQIVNLVHHDKPQVFQQVALGVEHVAQDLGRHDDNARGRINARVTRQQAYFVDTVDRLQILKFLVRQCFHRRRIERLVGHRLLRQVHRVVGDDCFARPGRGSNKDTPALVKRFAGFQLERVEWERLRAAKFVESDAHQATALASFRATRRS